MDLTGRPSPTDLARERLGPRFAAAGFVLTHDDSVEFDRPLRDHDDVDLVLRSFYAPTTTGAAAALLGRMIDRGCPGEFPGHVAALVDEQGAPVPAGEVGENQGAKAPGTGLPVDSA